MTLRPTQDVAADRLLSVLLVAAVVVVVVGWVSSLVLLGVRFL